MPRGEILLWNNLRLKWLSLKKYYGLSHPSCMRILARKPKTNLNSDFLSFLIHEPHKWGGNIYKRHLQKNHTDQAIKRYNAHDGHNWAYCRKTGPTVDLRVLSNIVCNDHWTSCFIIYKLLSLQIGLHIQLPWGSNLVDLMIWLQLGSVVFN